MTAYDKKEMNITVNDLPFHEFLTSGYSMTVKVNADKAYE